MKTLITGHFRDQQGRTYYLVLEPAISLENGYYLIWREFLIQVHQINN